MTKAVNSNLTMGDLVNCFAVDFPDYKIVKKGKSLLKLKKSKHINITICRKKNAFKVDVFFSGFFQKFIFYSVIFLLGLILPLIVYLFTFHRSFSKTRREIKAYIESK